MSITTREDPQIRFRVPKELKKWIKTEASRNGRSQSAEVAVRLRKMMEQEKAPGATTPGALMPTPQAFN
jgi:plasmid stability protein